MKKLIALLFFILPALCGAATNHYNIGDQTNITGGSFTNSTMQGTTTFPALTASRLLYLDSSRNVSVFPGTTCTNQAVAALSAAGAASCTSTFVGGGHTAMTALGIRSTGTGAFDLTIANSENLTAARTLTITLGNAARALTLTGNASISGTNTGDGNVLTAVTTTNASFYPLFVNSAADTTKAVNLGSGLTFNPSTNTLTTTTFSGAFSGTATTATNLAGGTTGAIPYQSGAGATSMLAATATAGQVLRSGASAAPSWSTATYPATAGVVANVLRSDGTNFLSTALQAGDLSNGVTGTVAVVLSTNPTLISPILITPSLGTPTAGTLTNATGLPISTGVSGLGTGVATALAVNVGSAGAPVVNGGALGTPSSGTLTNATGLPIASGVSGLGTGVATFLATPSSANLATAVTGETGSGALVFGTSPTLVTPVLGAAAATSINFGGSTLATYAEANMTPTVVGSTSAGVGTYTNQLGTYTRIGNRVAFNITVSWTATTGTGNLWIGGLPFASATGGNNSQTTCPIYTNDTTAGKTAFVAAIIAGESVIRTYSFTAGGGAANHPLPATGFFSIACTYPV